MASKITPEISPERAAVAKILREQIIPQIAQNGLACLVFGQTKINRKQLPPGVRFTRSGPLGKAVKRRSRDSVVLASWPDEAMEALRFPGICFVTAGEADIRVGDAVLHCPVGNGILFPAGVPRSAGHHAHWMRAHPEKAHSDIIWVNFNSSGAMCHRCQTRGTQHLSEYGWHSVVVDRRILTLVENLIAEIETKDAEYTAVGDAYLSAIFHILLRHMGAAPESAGAGASPPRNAENRGVLLPDLILSRARGYIENHLSQHMTLQDIAHAAYVSRARLAQIFREQTGQTVWEYVTARRLEEAKALLAQTDLYVYRIAYLTGFASPTTFTARFTEIIGVSPNEFRRQAQNKALKLNKDTI